MTITGPMALIGKKNPKLHEVSAPILLDELNHPRRLIELTDRMLATCRAKRGIAIAAPQVGVMQRVIVTWDGKVIINPELEFEDEPDLSEEIEGCLSLPGHQYRVERPSMVDASWVDLEGRDGWAKVEGLDARMFQHEVDHLDGILISERGTEVANANHGAMTF
jgi:peptide deformylase